jgi:ferritin-like metal-binding protein YciE
MSRTIDEQLVKYLADAHSIELQALAQLERAPAIAGDESLATAFREHLEETRGHERAIRERLEQLGAEPSRMKDIAGRAGGWAMIAFAKLNPDTPGKLTAHAYSYEHMELAAYELLARVAARAGAASVVEAANEIAAQERQMASRLHERFDAAVEASLKAKGAGDLREELISYLQDAQALETQAATLLRAGPRLARCASLAAAFEDHLAQTREHRRIVEERLRALGSSPQRVQEASMRLGGLGVGAFFGLQPDTPLKLAGFAYAFEHLEIAGYELLRRVAERADDSATATLAERILPDERTAAERVAATWDDAVDESLGKLTAQHARA